MGAGAARWARGSGPNGIVLLVGPPAGDDGSGSLQPLVETLRAQFGQRVAAMSATGEALFEVCPADAFRLDAQERASAGSMSGAGYERLVRATRRAGIRRAICAPGTPDALARALARAGLAVASMHDDESGKLDERAFAALARITPGLARISVVVPNYNYATHLSARLASVFAQSVPVFEVLVLDDGSSDDSLATLDRISDESGRRIRIVGSASNGGNVFAQWEKAAGLARGDYLWIAEADDLAAPRFLEACWRAFDPRTVLSFCDSSQIAADGKRLGSSYRRYCTRVAGALFRRDFSIDGIELVERALCERNVVLNGSAVLWRRTAMLEAIARARPDLAGYRLVGDWLLYLEALGLPGARVGYVATALNVHRRHRASVTGTYPASAHLAEIQAMQERARRMLAPDASREARVAAYLNEVRVQFARESSA